MFVPDAGVFVDPRCRAAAPPRQQLQPVGRQEHQRRRRALALLHAGCVSCMPRLGLSCPQTSRTFPTATRACRCRRSSPACRTGPRTSTASALSTAGLIRWFAPPQCMTRATAAGPECGLVDGPGGSQHGDAVRAGAHCGVHDGHAGAPPPDPPPASLARRRAWASPASASTPQSTSSRTTWWPSSASSRPTSAARCRPTLSCVALRDWQRQA